MASSLQHCGEFNFAAAFFCGSRARRWFANKITVFLGGSEERFTRFFRYFWKWWTIAFVTGGTVPERNGAGIRGRTPLIGMNECITNVLYILRGNYFASRRDEKFISRRYRLTLRWKKKVSRYNIRDSHPFANSIINWHARPSLRSSMCKLESDNRIAMVY